MGQHVEVDYVFDPVGAPNYARTLQKREAFELANRVHGIEVVDGKQFPRPDFCNSAPD